MPFSEVMLARPLDKKFVFEPGVFAVEEKLDGIRIESEISSGASNLFTQKLITPWSRYGRVHPLPTHIMEELAKFPPSGTTTSPSRSGLIVEIMQVASSVDDWSVAAVTV